MDENKHLETASQIVEKLIPNYFFIRLWQSEVSESGNFIKEYSEKAESIYKDLVKILEEKYGKSEG